MRCRLAWDGLRPRTFPFTSDSGKRCVHSRYAPVLFMLPSSSGELCGSVAKLTGSMCASQLGNIVLSSWLAWSLAFDFWSASRHSQNDFKYPSPSPLTTSTCINISHCSCYAVSIIAHHFFQHEGKAQVHPPPQLSGTLTPHSTALGHFWFRSPSSAVSLPLTSGRQQMALEGHLTDSLVIDLPWAA